MQEVMKILDKDGDGEISSKELLAEVHNRGKMSAFEGSGADEEKADDEDEGDADNDPET